MSPSTSLLHDHFEHKNNPANIVLSDAHARSARLILVSRHRPLPHQHGQGIVGASVPATSNDK